MCTISCFYHNASRQEEMTELLDFFCKQISKYLRCKNNPQEILSILRNIENKLIHKKGTTLGLRLDIHKFVFLEKEREPFYEKYKKKIWRLFSILSSETELGKGNVGQFLSYYGLKCYDYASFVEDVLRILVELVEEYCTNKILQEHKQCTQQNTGSD